MSKICPPPQEKQSQKLPILTHGQKLKRVKKSPILGHLQNFRGSIFWIPPPKSQRGVILGGVKAFEMTLWTFHQIRTNDDDPLLY